MSFQKSYLEDGLDSGYRWNASRHSVWTVYSRFHVTGPDIDVIVCDRTNTEGCVLNALGFEADISVTNAGIGLGQGG